MQSEQQLKRAGVPSTESLGNFLRAILARQEAAILIALAIFLAIFFVRNPVMLAPLTVSSILRTMAFPGIVAMGMVMLMIAGEIDLSTGAVMSLSAVLSAWLMTVAGLPIWLSLLLALAAAVGVGAINGLLSVKIGVHSVIATMSMLFAVRGASYLFTNGRPIYPLPPELAVIGKWTPLGLSPALFLMIVLMIGVQVLLNRTRWGSMIFATGGNKQAAQICGINTDRVKLLCFMFTSLLAGCTGILVMVNLPIPSGDPIIGRNVELDIIAGVILGGVSFYGGRGSAIGTFLGVLTIQVVRSGLVVARFDPYLQTAALGVLLLIAASVDVIRHRRSER